MASSNPAFSRNEAFGARGAVASSQALSDNDLQSMYNRPAAGSQDTERMTYEDTITKTGLGFALLLVAAMISWVATPVLPFLFILGAIAGFVLGLVNTFKKEPSAPLILAFAGAQGLFVGGISRFFEDIYGGVVMQAVLATLVVVGVTLALFRSGKIRASKRATQVFLVAMIAYGAFSLINLVLMLTGVTEGTFGLRSVEIFGIPLGAIIGVFVILLAAYSLVLDFTSIKVGVERGAPRVFGWQAAFAVMVTVVWLYVEILRLLAILRD